MERIIDVVIALGSNMGDREQHLEEAIERINDAVGEVVKRSHVYQTPPAGFEATTDFLNMCILVKSKLSAREILSINQTIELAMGRKRSENGYQSRPIDLDIIFYGNEIIRDEDLVIPHPRYQERNFVLYPLNDLQKDFRDPSLNKTIEQLISELFDESPIIRHEFQFFKG